MDLVQLQQNLLNIDPWETLKPILENHFELIAELNREQLSKGEKSNGSSLPDYKSDVYAEFKEKYVSTYSIYPTTDLRYSGDFYDAIKVSFSNYGISIESFDEKAKRLESKYGSSIYGLTDESITKLVSVIVDEFRQALKIQIFKN